VTQDVGRTEDALALFAEDLRALRRAAGKPTYRQLQQQTAFGRTVLSNALNGRTVPTWPVVQALVRALGADPEDWRARWAALPDAAEVVDGKSDSRDAGTGVVGPSPRERLEPRAQWPRVSIAFAAIALVLVVAAWFVVTRTGQSYNSPVPADGDQSMTVPATGVVGGRCMQVIAKDVRVFANEHGDDPWTRWVTGTKFWADADAGSTNRYRVTLGSGRHGWITTDPRYIAPAGDCP
jgi:hypothetical protein